MVTELGAGRDYRPFQLLLESIVDYNKCEVRDRLGDGRGFSSFEERGYQSLL